MMTTNLMENEKQMSNGRPAPTRRTMPGYLPGMVLAALVVGIVLGRSLWIERTALADPSIVLADAEASLAEALRTDNTQSFDRAYQGYVSILEEQPQHPEALRGAAIADIGLHRFEAARARAQQATELRPDDHIALAAFVDANIEVGNYEEAERQLDKLLALRPGLEAYSRLSYLRQLTGDPAGAVEAMFLARSAAAGLAYETTRVEGFLGEVFLAQGDLASAAEHFQQAHAGDPTKPAGRTGQGQVLIRQGDVEGAKSVADEVLLDHPDDTGALMLLAETSRRLGDDRTADEAANAVISAALGEHEAGFGVDPSAPLFASSWGNADDGLRLAEILYEERPANVKVAHAYAWALHQVGRQDEAIGPMQEAIRFGVSDSLLAEHAAIVLGPADPVKIAYGADPEQHGFLTVPVAADPVPVVVLLHGGFWRSDYATDLMDPLVDSLVDEGFAVWNLEYRRVGQDGGGFPGTLLDVAAGIDELAGLATEHNLDTERVLVVGHSAGGHLALWANGRSGFAPEAIGARPVVEPLLAVGLAAVTDLRDASDLGLGGRATDQLMGGRPLDVEDDYVAAQPDLSIGNVVLFHGADDDIVPVSQALGAASHPNVDVRVVGDADHFDVIDPQSVAWSEVLNLLRRTASPRSD